MCQIRLSSAIMNLTTQEFFKKSNDFLNFVTALIDNVTGTWGKHQAHSYSKTQVFGSYTGLAVDCFHNETASSELAKCSISLSSQRPY